jgi:hypothetical protein
MPPTLQLIMFILLVMATDCMRCCHAAGVESVPDDGHEEEVIRYPEIWDRFLPDEAKQPYRVFDINGNDYLIAYYSRYESDGEARHIYFKGMTFFEGKTFGEMELSSLLRKYSSVRLENQIVTFDNIQITLNNLDQREPKRCPQTLNNFFSFKFPNGKEVQKSLIVILDEPRIQKVNSRCADTNEKKYYEKVYSVAGRFVAVNDGTFLLIPFKGDVVIRFDSKMNTRSNLMGRKVFLVDTDIVRQFTSKIEVQGYQSVHDGLIKYLDGGE